MKPDKFLHDTNTEDGLKVFKLQKSEETLFITVTEQQGVLPNNLYSFAIEKQCTNVIFLTADQLEGTIDILVFRNILLNKVI
jgi:hypothetical protein